MASDGRREDWQSGADAHATRPRPSTGLRNPSRLDPPTETAAGGSPEAGPPHRPEPASSRGPRSSTPTASVRVTPIGGRRHYPIGGRCHYRGMLEDLPNDLRCGGSATG